MLYRSNTSFQQILLIQFVGSYEHMSITFLDLLAISQVLPQCFVLLVGCQEEHLCIWPVKLSDDMLVWLFVWSEVQIVCIWSS